MMWVTHSQNKATLPRNSAVYRIEALIGASGYSEPKRYPSVGETKETCQRLRHIY